MLFIATESFIDKSFKKTNKQTKDTAGYALFYLFICK